MPDVGLPLVSVTQGPARPARACAAATSWPDGPLSRARIDRHSSQDRPAAVFVSVNRPHRLVVAVSRVVQMRPELAAWVPTRASRSAWQTLEEGAAS